MFPICQNWFHLKIQVVEKFVDFYTLKYLSSRKPDVNQTGFVEVILILVILGGSSNKFLLFFNTGIIWQTSFSGGPSTWNVVNCISIYFLLNDLHTDIVRKHGNLRIFLHARRFYVESILLVLKHPKTVVFGNFIGKEFWFCAICPTLQALILDKSKFHSLSNGQLLKACGS